MRLSVALKKIPDVLFHTVLIFGQSRKINYLWFSTALILAQKHIRPLTKLSSNLVRVISLLIFLDMQTRYYKISRRFDFCSFISNIFRI